MSEITIGKQVTSQAACIVGHSQYGFDYLGVGGIWNNGSSLINRIDVLVTSGTMYGVFALEGLRGA
jgi:hypothetical protein